MAHGYGKSMAVDQIEADAVISDGMESLFPILIHLVDKRIAPVERHTDSECR